jgi:hypothetical protein
MLRTVRVQRRVLDIFGQPSWKSVRSMRVGQRRMLTTRVVAGEGNRNIFRAVARPGHGRPIASRAASIKIWHWYPMSTFDSYYSTAGVFDHSFTQFAMNGRTYVGSWFTTGDYGSWESRYTLGRHCRTMRGTFGVTDRSADGSSATISVLAEGTKTVYDSPPMVPGAVETRTIALATPYRVSVLGTNTSPDDLLAYPAVGDFQFLCSGLA